MRLQSGPGIAVAVVVVNLINLCVVKLVNLCSSEGILTLRLGLSRGRRRCHLRVVHEGGSIDVVALCFHMFMESH